jgi:hypothetical protein
MGRYWEAGGSLGAVIIGCVVYGIQLGWAGVVCGLPVIDHYTSHQIN